MIVEFFKSRGIYYGWVVLFVAFITTFLVLGTRYAFGVFYAAILEDTGWQRGETAGIFSVAMITYAVSAYLSGAFFDRFGPRILFPVSAVIMSLGLYLCSTIDSLFEFYLYFGVLVGIGFSLLGFIPHMAMVPRWFVKRRGLASAIALSGIGFGSLLLSVISERAIALVGWREALWLLAILILVILTPLNFFLHRDRPEDIGLLPDGNQQSLEHSDYHPPSGPTLPQAFRQKTFWLLGFSVFVIGLGSMTMVVHQTKMLVDMGFSLSLAAGLFGFTGMMRSIGSLFWGPVSDKIGLAPCITIISILGSAGIGMLILATYQPSIVYLVLFILFWGVGFTGMPPIYAVSVATHYQGEHLGKILGMLDLGFGVGAAIGPFLAGVNFDIYGSYISTLWVLLVAILLMGFTLTSAARIKKA